MPSPTSAVYVHVPFCRSLCAYCDFYSVTADSRDMAPLVEALVSEVNQRAGACELAVETIYVGGGTPTVLPAPLLGRLLGLLAGLPRGDGALEFTVEANPATVTPETAETLAHAGVNRVSIGAQSFDQGELRTLGRTHLPADVAETVAACRRVGIDNISLDLIFAIPGQTVASWRASLEAALALEPQHISCYSLTYEEGTRLTGLRNSGRVQPIDEETDTCLFELTIELLTGAGFEHYEISNFARPGARCRHNLTYWLCRPYLGIGPAAAGLLGNMRYKNVADVAGYVAAIQAGQLPMVEQERRSVDELAREAAMLGLRLIEGLDRNRFRADFGHDPLEFFPDAVRRNVERGLVTVSDRSVRLTRQGLLLADDVVADFLCC